MNENIFLETRKPRPKYFEMIGECHWRFADLVRTTLAMYKWEDKSNLSEFNEIIKRDNYNYYEQIVKGLRKIGVCEEVVTWFNKIRIKRNLLSHSVVRIVKQCNLAHLVHLVRQDNKDDMAQLKLIGYDVTCVNSESFVEITYSFLQDMILEIKSLSQHFEIVKQAQEKGLDEKSFKPKLIGLPPDPFINDNMFMGLISRGTSIWTNPAYEKEMQEQIWKDYHKTPSGN